MNALKANSSARNYWFDNAKGFLILTVFIGHICEILIKLSPFENGRPLWLDVLMKFIYVFHMPVFMIISGRFAKSRIDQNDWIAIINKLVIPYILVQTVMMLFYTAVGYSEVGTIYYFKPGYGLWYLFTLAIFQFITPHLLKIFRRPRLLFPISLVVAFLVTFQKYAFPGTFQRIFTFFPFFIFGYLTANYDLNFCKKPLFRIISLIAFVALILFIIQYNDIVKVAVLSGKRVYSQYHAIMDVGQIELLIMQIIRYVLGFIFYFFVLGICSIKKTAFSRLGMYSSHVYILHLFIVVAITALGKNVGLLNFCKNEIYAILLCVSAIPISFLLTASPIQKITNWLIAPKFDLKKLFQTIIADK